MKVLIVMGGFLPGKKYGGPPVSVDNFCSLLKGNVECFIVTHNHDMGEKTPYENLKPGWNERENTKVLYLTDKDYCATSFEKVISDIKPDYLYLQGLFQSCVYSCLRLAKKHRIKVVLAPRGELCAGAFKKKYKKLPYIYILRLGKLLNNVHFQSTSEEETDAIQKYLGVDKDRVHLLTNIPSIPKHQVAHPLKNAGSCRLVFISRILWKKNLLSALKSLKRVQGDVIFDIYGPKEDEGYWKECEEVISTMPSNVRVEYKGVLSHEDIHDAFSQYDAFLFPTLSENYGHVIAEALVSGCIPVISDQTPWNDLNEHNAGWAIPLDDEEGYKNAIHEIIEMDEECINVKRSAIGSYLDQKLRMKELKSEYLSVFK